MVLTSSLRQNGVNTFDVYQSRWSESTVSRNGVISLAPNGGVYGWNFGRISTGQLLRARVRVRNSDTAKVGFCVTEGDHQSGYAVWGSEKHAASVATSFLAKLLLNAKAGIPE